MAYPKVGKKVNVFVEFPYQAKSWTEPHRGICTIEVSEKGRNVRFIVTDMNGKGPQRMYDESYCGRRGRMENFIRNHKNALHSDRTSRATGLAQIISGFSCTVRHTCFCIRSRRKGCEALNRQKRNLIQSS